jgi:hypothetical protein
MNDARDEQVDASLMSALADEPLEDDGFTRGVIDLINRRRRRRRAVLAVAWASAAAIGVTTLPADAASGTPVTGSSLAAMMVLSTMVSLVWTATVD